jgi:glycopeptide antibiotics resistance protein
MDRGLYIGSEHALLASLGIALILVLHGLITRARKRTIAARVFGVVYGAWVISMTLLPMMLGPAGDAPGLDPYWQNSVNLVPGETIRLYLESDLGPIAWQNLLGNLLLLLPFGALGPWAWRRLNSWKRVLGFGLAVSVGIEFLQFARRFVDTYGIGRSVDIDDVLLNTLGALLGYLMYRIGHAIVHIGHRGEAEGEG